MEARFLREPDPQRSWELFMEECLPTLMTAARRSTAGDDEEARDVVAEVLGRLRGDWPRLLRRFEEARVRAEVGFRIWFSVVARNMAIDVLRARHGRAMAPRPVARLPAWKRRLWELAVVQERSVSDARDELAREGLFAGSLEEVAATVQEIEATLGGAARRSGRPRLRARGGDAEGGFPDPRAPLDQEPASLLLRRAAHAALRKNLADLDPEQRFLLRLYFLEGATAAEVARVSGLRSTDQVYDRVKALMRHLREAAERCGLGPDDLVRLADFDWAASLASEDSPR